MQKIGMLFPGGLRKCLTFSYDDGNHADRRLTELFARYGMKATFNLNSGTFGGQNIAPEEVRTLYEGQEVASHTVSHPNLVRMADSDLAWEILEDCRALEALTGRRVDGFAYPYGTWNDAVIRALEACGIRYARTVNATGGFFLPERWLCWHPTCHHDDPRLMDLGNSLIRDQASQHLRLMYVWGHSYEFDRNDNWRRMEDFCALMAGKPDIWYAANGQIVDAAENFARLRIARDHSFVYNPSADPVWISVGNRAVKVPGGTRISLTGEKCQ
ncbi:MAG: polysaccharide deacetylase family protein [Clostridia bacterium]|nr:polysaccharide deacetylase family protein [Clostridia bacterium]